MAALAFERQYGVDHMFQHAGSGDRPVLGNMADEHQRRAAFLGKADKLLRRCADLADRARCAFDEVTVHGLNGIDDQ